MKKAKAALIGISGYARTHLGCLANLTKQGKIDFSAAVVRHPEKNADGMELLRELGTKVYPSAEEMYAEQTGLDLVCIPTGISSHESMTLQALEHGANVLVEKPAAGSSAEILRMMEAEKKSGKFIAIAFQHIYAREVHFIKQYLLSGRLGNVKRITCKGVWPRADVYYQRNNWAGRIAAENGTPILDSPINNAFAHYLNLELFFAGRSFASSAHADSVEGELYRARKEIETFDTCALRFHTTGGTELQIMVTHTAEISENPVIRIECEKGAVCWKVDGSWNIRNDEGAVLYSGLVEAPHSDMFMDTVRKINGENTFLCPLSVAMEHTLCIEMITKELTPKVLESSVTRLDSNGQFVLKDVNEIFREGFLTNRLPSEMGIRWN